MTGVRNGGRRPLEGRRRLAAAATLLAAGSIVWGCTGQASAMELATSGATRAAPASSAAIEAATATTAFGIDLLHAGDSAGNLVFSPASIVFALGMARAGAAGETATQMDAVMHSAATVGSGNGLNSLAQALSALSGPVKVAGETQQLTLRIANATFAQRGYPVKAAYLDTLASRFGAGLRLVDFGGDPAGAVRSINGWVSDETEGRIAQLLDGLPPATRLVLANAIYLKAPWQSQFEPGATASRPFTRFDGSQVSVPTMAEGLECDYAERSGWQAADLPYAGGSLVMTVIVPDDFAAFERGLTAQQFDAIVTAMKPVHVELMLPRFKTETKAELSPTLAAMGMPLAFDPAGADFSGMTAAERLFIGLVVHQATISVDEKGTEATAATAIAMAAAASGAPPGATLHVDRPFLFAVRDAGTGAVLFLGRIVDPTA